MRDNSEIHLGLLSRCIESHSISRGTKLSILFQRVSGGTLKVGVQSSQHSYPKAGSQELLKRILEQPVQLGINDSQMIQNEFTLVGLFLQILGSSQTIPSDRQCFSPNVKQKDWPPDGKAGLGNYLQTPFLGFPKATRAPASR
jgi:hypothetical protein